MRGVRKGTHYFLCPRQKLSIVYPCENQLTRMCSSRSAVTMCASSGVSANVVRRDACPRMSVPPDGFACEARVSDSTFCEGAGVGVGCGTSG
jgi:putative hemolysin